MAYTLEDARREIALLQQAMDNISKTVDGLREDTDENTDALTKMKELRDRLAGGWSLALWLGGATLGASCLAYNLFSWGAAQWLAQIFLGNHGR